MPPIISDLYMLCAVGGFLYLVCTAGLGFMHSDSGGGDSGDGGDAGSADASGDAGGVDAGGDAGGIDAGGDGGGGDASGDLGSADFGDMRHVQGHTRAAGLAHARTSTQRQRRLNIGLLVLKITSPYTVACFSFFFGLTGLILSKYTPLGIFALIPATILGVIGYRAMTAVMNNVADKLYSSSTHKEEDVIGTVAELTVPIAPGRTGEIIYLNHKTRHVAPAKAKDPTSELSKTSKVMIADIVDGVFIVEPYEDFDLDDSVMIANQKLQNS
jgi:hypothetical protein